MRRSKCWTTAPPYIPPWEPFSETNKCGPPRRTRLRRRASNRSENAPYSPKSGTYLPGACTEILLPDNVYWGPKSISPGDAANFQPWKHGGSWRGLKKLTLPIHIASKFQRVLTSELETWGQSDREPVQYGSGVSPERIEEFLKRGWGTGAANRAGRLGRFTVIPRFDEKFQVELQRFEHTHRLLRRMH
jgi:hypothetical protein